MITLVSLLISTVLFIQNPSTGTGSEPSIEALVIALNEGDSHELAKFFDSSISLSINGQQADYSKNQAELVLKDFFRKNPPMGFQVIFQSDNNPNLSTYIGEYHSNQSVMKVFIKAINQASKLRVYSLEFVKA